MTAIEHEEVERAVKKTKLDGLKRLSVEQLTELHDATGAELSRRARSATKKKPVSELSDRAFEELKRKYFDGESDE
jgi:hypothetical protein